MTATEAVSLIQDTFAGVRLEGGISLRQAKLIDDGSDQNDERWEQVRALEVVEDWTKIPERDLDELPYFAHADAAGFRYYLPALLTYLGRSYDPIWLHVIQVLQALNPKEESWNYHMVRYSRLTPAQKVAVARFLAGLPSVVKLAEGDAATVAEALRGYWGQFIWQEKG